MALYIKPSDLKYRYPKAVPTRFDEKFRGEGDTAPFNRDDLYDIIPLLQAAMDRLGRDDARALHLLEDLLNEHLPRFISTRGEVFLFLVNCAQEIIEEWH